ncbi:5'-methylthioadenosine/adenosylhomocysteine nucleosidase [Ruminococcus sp.]|uniref:5'-methylthioadenosine/adenosylhomocysteine nucleosidase n=1 Tax=Ruminococcus sp. TaxID=41978 RepID=UPI0025F80B6D|nr:5'-methylthioadenosine/adenosylhomocysteine nucleosidase [Ruminococcus sp.]MCI6616489.1 5'-methylthioadenosine/adenosylhomocysteine nucleosidase [Ruminococcus sp.]
MIGIICAMQIEADGIIALCENVKTTTHAKMKFTLGTLHGRDVCIVVCGVGKVNAAMCALMLIEKYKPDLVLNSGVAGSLSPIVGIGDIVVATKSVEHDMNGTALGDKQGEITFPDGNMMFFECDKQASTLLASICKEIPDTKVAQGIIASGDIFVSDRKQRFKINDRFGALACEMEGAAIGHVCVRCEVPYGIIRAISDDLDENKGMDFVKFCELASKKTVAAVSGFVKAYSDKM